jgi:hypothetical protein
MLKLRTVARCENSTSSGGGNHLLRVSGKHDVGNGITMTNAFSNIIQGVNRLQNVLAQAEDDESGTNQADAMQTRRTWARWALLFPPLPLSVQRTCHKARFTAIIWEIDEIESQNHLSKWKTGFKHSIGGAVADRMNTVSCSACPGPGFCDVLGEAACTLDVMQGCGRRRCCISTQKNITKNWTDCLLVFAKYLRHIFNTE